VPLTQFGGGDGFDEEALFLIYPELQVLEWEETLVHLSPLFSPRILPQVPNPRV